MGRDKALLPHPEGGTWLERTLRVLATTGAPLTLLSRWPRHLELAAAWRTGLAADGLVPELLQEPEPAEGPLLALRRLMHRHPDQRLLLCPVDMPALSAEALATLLLASAVDLRAITIAMASQPQPLLGVYPSDDGHRQRLDLAVAAGERRLQGWLAGEQVRRCPLDPGVLANVNTRAELEAHARSRMAF